MIIRQAAASHYQTRRVDLFSSVYAHAYMQDQPIPLICRAIYLSIYNKYLWYLCIMLVLAAAKDFLKEFWALQVCALSPGSNLQLRRKDISCACLTPRFHHAWLNPLISTLITSTADRFGRQNTLLFKMYLGLQCPGSMEQSKHMQLSNQEGARYRVTPEMEVW